MFIAKERLKLLLIQARLETAMADHELSCLVQSAGVPAPQWKVVDATREALVPQLLRDCDALMIGGTGDFSVAKDRPPFLNPLLELSRAALDRGLPCLGLCYGFHLMAKAVGGTVVRSPERSETGTFPVVLTPQGKLDPLLSPLPEEFLAQQGHHDVVESMPSHYLQLATSQRCFWQGFKHPQRPYYGLQFHPELGRDDFMLRMRRYSHEYATTPERLHQIDEQVQETTIQGIIARFVDLVVQQEPILLSRR